MSTAPMFCRSCGKPLTEEEKTKPDNVYCSACVPAQAPAAAQAPPAAAPMPPSSGISPGLAFLLGCIPGVGAIYNGQYAKGVLHAVIFGMLVTLSDSPASRGMGTVVGLLIMAWFFYMPFEAYHTAKRRLNGEPVEEFSGLVSLENRGGFPVAPVLLIALGILFLLNNLEIITIAQLLRYWPVFLIALGVYMLYVRLSPPAGDSAAIKREEVNNEQ